MDDGFLPFHRLYHRCKKEDFEGDWVFGARMRYNNTSVNWSKYSKPWDVIFDHAGHGIVQFMVCQLPKELPKEPTPGARRDRTLSFLVIALRTTTMLIAKYGLTRMISGSKK